MTFFLQTIGGLRLVGPDENEVAFPEKGLLLLAYLLTTRSGSAHRSELADFLWSHEDSGASLTNLRKAISRIKVRQSELGIRFLDFKEGLICVDGSVLSSDVLSASDEIADPFIRLRSLVAILKQSFLGPTRLQTRDFEAWLVRQTDMKLQLLKETLQEVSGQALDDLQSELVKGAAILLFRLQPNDADTLQLLVRIFNAEGDVDFLRSHFEQRSNAIVRGQSVLNSALTMRGVASAGAIGAQAIVKAAADMQTITGEKPAVGPVIPRLVLLAPVNQSGRQDAGLLAGCLIEDITIGFCAFNSVQVIAPHSAVQIGAQIHDPDAFFERHSVNYILETRVMWVGEELSMFAQLVFYNDSRIVWAERFSLNNLDLIRERRLIARRIALSVSGEIERNESTRSYIELNAIAYHRYLIGRRHMNRLTLPNLRRARKEMKGSLTATADFAPALSSIARTYSKEWLLTARGDVELLKSAEAFASRAIEARSDMSDGYREFGIAKLLQGAFDESTEAMELAEILGPHYADVIADYADTLVHCSRPSMALQKIERAIELNPISPDPYFWTAAGANYALGQFHASLDYIDQMADPSLADRLSAANWAMLGHKDKANFHVRRVREANPDFDVDRWLAAVPTKEQWHRDLYRDGLKKAGF